MSAGSLSDSTPAATFSRRHLQVMEIASRDWPPDHLKSRTNDRCISPTALRRFSRPAATAAAQKHKRGKARGRLNPKTRDVGEEISPKSLASLYPRSLRSTAHDRAVAKEPVRGQSTNLVAQPASRPQ